MTLYEAIATIANVKETDLAKAVRRTGNAVAAEAIAYAQVLHDETDDNGDLISGATSSERINSARVNLDAALAAADDAA